MNFSKTITKWYSINKRDLPWRNTKNPYKIWLSEIILQQTQVKQGLPYYNAFIEAFPDVAALANADEETVLKLWQGLGYYSRARNLHTTAKLIHFEYNNCFPNSYHELIKLKGIGDYTASAIASFCFNLPHAVLDGNVFRVLARVYGINDPINSSKGIKVFKALAEEILNSKDAATHNQAVMEFGALQCKPKNPDCSICPLNSICIANNQGLIETLPIKTSKIKITKKYFNFIVIISQNKQTIIEKRTQKGIWQNLYQFPLFESNHSLSIKDIDLFDLKTYLGNHKFEITQYNTKDIVHKLSHQHLFIKFWVVETNKKLEKGIPLTTLKSVAVPVVISRFIEEFTKGI